MPAPKAVWLHGNALERREKLASALKAYENDDIVRLDDVSFAYLENQILAESCFSAKRLVVLDSMPSLTVPRPTYVNHFKKLIDVIPSTVLLVFNGIDPSDWRAISDHVGKVGAIVQYETKLTRNEAPQWLVKEAARLGKTLTVNDAGILTESCGFDTNINAYSVDQLRLAILKTAFYVGTRKAITNDDILTTAYPSEEFVIWQIFDAMDSKDASKCYSIFNKLVSHSPDLKTAVESLFTTSLWRFRLLFFLQEAKTARKLSVKELYAENSGLMKFKQSGRLFRMKMEPDLDESGKQKAAYTEKTAEKAIVGVWGKPAELATYSRKELFRIIQCLQDGMAEIRYRQLDSTVQLLADSLFLSICTQVDNDLLKTLRAHYEF